MDHTSTFLLLPQECFIHLYSCSHLSSRAHGVLDQSVALNSCVIIVFSALTHSPSMHPWILRYCMSVLHSDTGGTKLAQGSPSNVDQWVQSELAILLLFCSYEICNPMLCTLAHSTSQAVWWSCPTQDHPQTIWSWPFHDAQFDTGRGGRTGIQACHQHQDNRCAPQECDV